MPNPARASDSRHTMKFRDDIDLANTWVTSDSHFGHDNIVGFCHRPEDHEQVMIAEWRKVVPDDATVLHLGDLCYRGNGFFKNIVAKELTGARLMLIKGNHDKQRMNFYRDCGFHLTRPFKLGINRDDDGFATVERDKDRARYAEHIVSFSHYPWNTEAEGRMEYPRFIRIHGHIHNNGYTRDEFVPFLLNHINLSAEQTRYTPVNLKLLLDGALYGKYPESTPEQIAEARRRKVEAQEAGQR